MQRTNNLSSGKSSTSSGSGNQSSPNLPSAESSPSPEALERAELVAKAMLTQNSLALEAQLEERPLAKKQEELVASAEASFGEAQQTGAENKPAVDTKETEDGASTSSKSEKVARKALLKNDDLELERVSKVYTFELHN
jgi:RNA polymerase II subunit A-like phosphatase